MNKIPSIIRYQVYGLFGLIFIVLNFGIGTKLQNELPFSLQKLTGFYFAISMNIQDYLALAFIPIFGMIYNSERAEFKVKELIVDILTVLFCVIIVF